MRKKYKRKKYSERWQYVKDVLTEHNKKTYDLARMIGECERKMSRSLCGDRKVSEEEAKEIAQALARFTGRTWEYHIIEILRRKAI